MANEQWNSLIVKEERRFGKIGYQVYLRYFKAMRGAVFFAVPIFLTLLAASSTDSLFRYFVSLWVEGCTDKFCTHFPFMADISQHLRTGHNFKIAIFFFLFSFVAIGIGSLNWALFSFFMGNGARYLHHEMVESFSGVRVTFFDENPTGRLIRRFSGDYSQITDDIPHLIQDILSSIFEIIVLCFIIVFQAPLLIGTFVPCAYLYYRIQSIFKPASREIQRYIKILESPLWSVFNETIFGYQTIRAYNRVDDFMQRVFALGLQAGRASLLQGRFMRWLNLRLKFISEIFTLCVTLFVIYLVATGRAGVGRAGFLMSLTLGLDSTMNWLTRSISLIESKMVSTERVLEYRSLPNEELEKAKFHKDFSLEKSTPPTLEIRNYSASYRRDLPVILKNITAQFGSGLKIGIIGRTGSGKSTLFQSLFRMVEKREGDILVDGHSIYDMPLDFARSLFSIVPQDPHLFSGSVRSNLDRTGKFSDAEMFRALGEVNLLEYIQSLPGQLDYPLSERGSNFSVGQKQLLCFARALLCQRPLLLMDEATANIDLKTDLLIQKAMERSFQNKTALIIAHRLETLHNTDQILVVGDGKVLDFGPTADILKKYHENIKLHLE